MLTRSLIVAAFVAVCAAAPAAETVELAGLTGNVPDGWKKGKPSNSMRRAQYSLPKADGDAEDAELSVFEFATASGSLKDNLARQTAAFVPAGRTDSDAKIKVGPHDATIQDVSGTYKKKPFPMATDFTPVENYRQLYVVFEAGGKQFYLKLLGPKATVEKNKKSFEAFLASFK